MLRRPSAGRSGDVLLPTDAREGARSGRFGVAHLARLRLVPPPLSLAGAGPRIGGKGPRPEALVLLTSLLLFPPAVLIHAAHAEPVVLHGRNSVTFRDHGW